jgi:hypothetical protein
MITDDEVMQLFARADPARLNDDFDAAEVDDTLGRMRTRRDHLTIVEPDTTSGSGRNRQTWWLVKLAAAAAVVLVVAGALVVLVGSRDDPITSVASQPPVATSPAAPEPPPSRPDPLEEFATWAERRGTPVVRPACTTVAGVTASAVTCYGLIRADGPGFSGVLVASAVVGDMGVDPFIEVEVGEDSTPSVSSG